MGNHRIVLVEYLNTEPYLQALQSKGKQFELIRKIPAECARSYINGEVDIALVPLASFFKMKNSKIITDYGIGCSGAVRTVMVFGNQPIEELHTIYLDSHSRTSVELVKIILNQYWGMDINFRAESAADSKLNFGEGVLMIGDKVFKNEAKFSFSLDLGEEWKIQTGLPFVFAVWVANENLSKEVEQTLNEILEYGVSQIPDIIKALNSKNKMDLSDYFQNNISYKIEKDGRKAIKLFHHKMSSNPSTLKINY